MPRVTVGPISSGGWQVTGEPGSYGTQSEALAVARRQLVGTGGGELVVKGRDGKVRDQRTIGRRDPRGTRG